MLTGLGWLFGILSRLSKGWREQRSWGSFSDLLTSLSRQTLAELPCLKWKSPQGILAVPHFELTSDYYRSPCCHPPPRPSITLPLYLSTRLLTAGSCTSAIPNPPGTPSSCHVTPRLTVLHATFGLLLSSLTSPRPYNPPHRRWPWLPWPPEGPVRRHSWIQSIWREVPKKGEDEGPTQRWRKPLLSRVCKMFWETARSWGKRFHNFPGEDKSEWRQRFQPLPGWKGAPPYLKEDSDLASSTRDIFQA